MAETAQAAEVVILGIDRHVTGQWRVRAKVKGRRRDFYAGTEQGAHQRAAALESLTPGQLGELPRDLPEAVLNGNGTPEDWQAALWFLARELMQDPANEALQRLARVLPSLAQVAVKVARKPPRAAEEQPEEEPQELIAELYRKAAEQAGLNKGKP